MLKLRGKKNRKWKKKRILGFVLLVNKPLYMKLSDKSNIRGAFRKKEPKSKNC